MQIKIKWHVSITLILLSAKLKTLNDVYLKNNDHQYISDLGPVFGSLHLRYIFKENYCQTWLPLNQPQLCSSHNSLTSYALYFCLFLSMQDFDDFIFAFFAIEMVIKMVALGIFGKKCYLGDTWNRLDFFIVLAGWVTQLHSQTQTHRWPSITVHKHRRLAQGAARTHVTNLDNNQCARRNLGKRWQIQEQG